MNSEEQRKLRVQQLAQQAIDDIENHWAKVDRWRALPWYKKLFKKRDFSPCYDSDGRKI